MQYGTNAIRQLRLYKIPHLSSIINLLSATLQYHRLPLQVRKTIVSKVRRGLSLRQAAAHFGVAVSTVAFGVKRAGQQRLERIRWSDHSRHRPALNRVAKSVEQCVLHLRKELKEQCDLGELGAEAIRYEMDARGCNMIPSRATINRILQRNGMLDGKPRKRLTPPPQGWYLPNNEE
jgi:transposase